MLFFFLCIGVLDECDFWCGILGYLVVWWLILNVWLLDWYVLVLCGNGDNFYW